MLLDAPTGLDSGRSHLPKSTGGLARVVMGGSAFQSQAGGILGHSSTRKRSAGILVILPHGSRRAKIWSFFHTEACLSSTRKLGHFFHTEASGPLFSLGKTACGRIFGTIFHTEICQSSTRKASIFHTDFCAKFRAQAWAGLAPLQDGSGWFGALSPDTLS